jgi:uncharacterized protein (DUF1800 family)
MQQYRPFSLSVAGEREYKDETKALKEHGMRRLARVPVIPAVFLTVAALHGQVANRLNQKLTVDKQIVHVLNRLTFGVRATDVSEVRRIGVEKWIDLQLHPQRIPENPALESKLKPLESVQLPTWQIMERYSPTQVKMVRPAFPLQTVLTPLQISKLMNGGTVEERRAVLASLDPDVRRQVLMTAPPQVLDGLPELQQEIAKEREAEQQARQLEMRRLMPPLNELLTQEQIRTARTGTDEQKVALLSSFDPDMRRQILRAIGPQAFAGLSQFRREAMAATQPQQLVNIELIENKLYRAIYSNRQLEEVLVDFWLNHFNVYNGKAQIRVLLTSYERDAIRPHVLGRFEDLLLATARHPAMLIYLDNVQSQAIPDNIPQPIGPNGAAARRPGINENYGRELLELHTLGVDGGYTQEDVIAVARAFTGWTVFDPGKYAEFQFNPAVHDRKEKIVLGHTLSAGRGEQDGLDVIDILSRHPSTAKFISKKLAQRFVADEPPETLVNRMTASFTKSDGDLRAVLETMFASPEFLSEAAWQAKIKSPLEMVVSAVRALNAEATDTFPLSQRIAELGQPLYAKVEPTGYPNTGESWTSAGAVLGRINFATALTAGQIPGVKPDVSRFNFKPPAIVAAELLGIGPTSATLDAIEKGIEGKEVTPSMLAAVVLGSPEFQKR